MKTKAMRTKQTRNLAFWTLSWTLSTALVVFGDEFIWNGANGFTISALLLNLFLGIGMVLAHRRLLKYSDELEQKIHLESMGLTLGLTLIVGLAYSMMDITNLIPWDAEISFLVMFMGICYIITILFNTKRYR
jgi:hypothetical protein